MYEEFLIGYILSGLAVLLLIVVIILQCVILAKIKRTARGSRGQDAAYNPYAAKGAAYGGNAGTVICRNCATQYGASHYVCPKCGTTR